MERSKYVRRLNFSLAAAGICTFLTVVAIFAISITFNAKRFNLVYALLALLFADLAVFFWLMIFKIQGKIRTFEAAKQNAAPAPVVSSSASSVSQPLRVSISNVRTWDFNVAGVRFKNSEGKSRQRILKELYDTYGESMSADLEKYQYKDEDAVRVRVYDEDIGNVARADLPLMLSIMDKATDVYVELDAFVPPEEDKDVYYARLFVETPIE